MVKVFEWQLVSLPEFRNLNCRMTHALCRYSTSAAHAFA
jgi:hypothetical protein